MLRETKRTEEAGLGVENLPLLTESIHIVNGRLTISRNHVAHSEIAHETSAITKVLALALLNQDRNNVLVGLDLDTLAITQMHFKDMLLVSGLCVCERANPENSVGNTALNTPLSQ
jgi:hypothetical protein